MQIQTVTLLETGRRHQSMVTREGGKPVNIVTLEQDRLDAQLKTTDRVRESLGKCEISGLST